MRRTAIVVACAALCATAAQAYGQPQATPDAPAAPPPATATTATPPADTPKPAAKGEAAKAEGDKALPPGHPPTEAAKAEGDKALPPGHPPMDAAKGPPLAGRMTRKGLFQAAPDRVLIDKQLEPGTIVVQIIDAAGQPISAAPITLHVLHSSVMQGESRERIQVTTDEEGRYTFRSQDTGSGVSYQVRSRKGPAVFITQPFALRDEGGVRAYLHVYEPATELASTAIVIEGVVLLDVKQDNIAINFLLAIHNFGQQAFVTDGLMMPLPPEAAAFQQQEAMGQQQVVERDGSLALIGTFPPGTNQLTYRYQVPLHGSGTETLALPMPPRLISSRVVVGASKSMGMTVTGFPPAERGLWHDGKHVLETVGRPPMTNMASLRRSTKPTMLHITITGIPTPGWGRWLAAGLAFFVAAAGGVYLFRARRQRGLNNDEREELRDARSRLLDEMALLERARASGEVGPRTYDRLRRVLTDALARIIAQLGDGEGAQQEPYREPLPDRAAPKRRTKRGKKRPAVAET